MPVHYAYQGNFSILEIFKILYNPNAIYWESSIYSPSYWCKWKFWEMVDTRISRKHIKHRFPTFPEYLSPLEWAWELAFQNIFKIVTANIISWGESIKLSFRNNDHKTKQFVFFSQWLLLAFKYGMCTFKKAHRRQRLKVLYEFRVKPDVHSELQDTQCVTSRDFISHKKQK